MISKSKIVVLLSALGFLLSSCATLPPTENAAPNQAAAQALFVRHAAQVRAISEWQAEGRMAIRTGQTGGSVSFHWVQRGETTALTLNAPLNQGTLTLIGTPSLMRIEDSSGQRRITQHPDRTLTQLTGWSIPVEALPDWIRGLPHSSRAQSVFNAQGHLITSRDDDWTIQYGDYRPAFAGGIAMPYEMTVTHQDIFLRLIIDQWQGPSAAP